MLAITHCLIEKLEPKGYMYGSLKCPTLDTIIHNFRDLQIPVCNLVFDMKQLSLLKPPPKPVISTQEPIRPSVSFINHQAPKKLDRTPTVMGLQRTLTSKIEYDSKKKELSILKSGLNSDNANNNNNNTVKWKPSKPQSTVQSGFQAFMKHQQTQSDLQQEPDPYSKMPSFPGVTPTKSAPVSRIAQNSSTPSPEYTEMPIPQNSVSPSVKNASGSVYDELPPPTANKVSNTQPEVVQLNKPANDYTTIPTFSERKDSKETQPSPIINTPPVGYDEIPLSAHQRSNNSDNKNSSAPVGDYSQIPVFSSTGQAIIPSKNSELQTKIRQEENYSEIPKFQKD